MLLSLFGMSRQSRIGKHPRDEEEEQPRQRRRRPPPEPEPEPEGLSSAMHLRQQADAPPQVPDGIGEASIEDPMQTCPRDDIDWSKWVQDPNDPITDPDFCLWSVMGRTDSELLKTKHWQVLLDHYRLNKGEMPAFAFCLEQQEIYNERIRDHLVDKHTGKKCRGPAWPPQNIYNYTFKVRRTPNAFIENVMHTFFEMADVYQANQLFLLNTETGKRSVSNKDADMFMKMTDKAHKWFELYRTTKVNKLHAPN